MNNYDRFFIGVAALSLIAIPAVYFFYPVPQAPAFCASHNWCEQKFDGTKYRWTCGRGHWRSDALFCEVK